MKEHMVGDVSCERVLKKEEVEKGRRPGRDRGLRYVVVRGAQWNDAFTYDLGKVYNCAAILVVAIPGRSAETGIDCRHSGSIVEGRRGFWQIFSEASCLPKSPMLNIDCPVFVCEEVAGRLRLRNRRLDLELRHSSDTRLDREGKRSAPAAAILESCMRGKLTAIVAKSEERRKAAETNGRLQ